MTTRRGDRGQVTAWVAVIVCCLSFGAAGRVRAQSAAACVPACAAGETCVAGTCMVPAGRQPAAETPPTSESPSPVAAPAPETAPAVAPAAPPIMAAPGTVPGGPVPQSRLSAAPPSAPRTRQGTLFIPFLGLHSFQDSDDSGLDPGLRVGALVGSFVNNAWSMNAGVTFDVLNPSTLPPGIDVSGQILELTFSPLVHIGDAQAELVLGPKLGGILEWAHIGNSVVSADGFGQGWVLGGQMGAFFVAAPNVLAGLLLSAEVMDILHSCASGTGIESSCKSSGESATTVGFSFALML